MVISSIFINLETMTTKDSYVRLALMKKGSPKSESGLEKLV